MKRLVLAGAGHAHLYVIRRIPAFIRRHCRVTVVSAGDHHYYSGMGPGLLAGTYSPETAGFPVRSMTKTGGGSFVSGRVARIEADRNRIILDDGSPLDYDVLSCNLGSDVVPLQSATSALLAVKPIETLYAAGRDLEKRMKTRGLRALVVGGGAAGVEIAGNLEGLARRVGGRLDVTLVSQSTLLERFAPALRDVVRASFDRRNLRVVEHASAHRFEESQAVLQDGERIAFDVAFNAAGIRPSGVFRDSDISTARDGGLPVNAYLQCTDYPNVFGAGDCIAFMPRPLQRVGVYAVRQGPVLCANLMAAMSGGTLRSFRPQERYLSILNLGGGRGVAAWGPLVVSGRLALVFKHYIDRAFVNRFQVRSHWTSPRFYRTP